MPAATLRKRKPVMGAQLAAEQQAISAPGAAATMPPAPEPPGPPKSVPPAQAPPPPKPPRRTQAPALPPTPPPPPQPVAVPVVGSLPALMGGGIQGGAGGGTANQQAARDAARAQDEADLASQRDPGMVQADQDATAELTDLLTQGQTPDQFDAERLAQLDNGVDPAGGVGGGTEGGSGGGEFDDVAGDFLMQQLQEAMNGADTKEEEDLIRQQMEDAIGAQLVDQRASMGRAGFGSSGALAAMEGDIQRTARQQGLSDILGLRRTEDQRGIDNASNAIGSDIDLRKQAEDEFFNDEFLNVLKSQLGADGGAPQSNVDGIEDPGVQAAPTEVTDEGVIQPRGGYKNPFTSIAELSLALSNGQITMEQFQKFYDDMKGGF